MSGGEESYGELDNPWAPTCRMQGENFYSQVVLSTGYCRACAVFPSRGEGGFHDIACDLFSLDRSFARLSTSSQPTQGCSFATLESTLMEEIFPCHPRLDRTYEAGIGISYDTWHLASLHPLGLSNGPEAVCAFLLFWLLWPTPPCHFCLSHHGLDMGIHLFSTGNALACPGWRLSGVL